jgi:probable O-glycosylation ligase (exosortase A-associated)
LVFGILALFGFMLIKKPVHIKWRAQSIITGILVVWMTLTLAWAVAPQSALIKWDWAIKSLVFTIIIPHFLQSRRDFEAFIWTIVSSGMAHCISFGAKVILSGGGYGISLGLIGGNSGYAESSTLAMFAVSIVPMCIYLYLHQTIIPYRRLAKLMLVAFIMLALATAIGTYARTAFVCMAMLAISFIYFNKRKMRSVIFVLILGIVSYQFTTDGWLNRMSSIDDGTDSSAMGRVAVWKWVIEYVAQNPLGGSFTMYVINSYALELVDGSVIQVSGKAFHSVFFEMLGEGGVPGILLYLSLIGFSLHSFLKYRKLTPENDCGWLLDSGRYLLVSTLIFLAGGAFIGVAFQSYFYYLAALSAAYLNLLSLHGHIE